MEFKEKRQIKTKRNMKLPFVPVAIDEFSHSSGEPTSYDDSSRLPSSSSSVQSCTTFFLSHFHTDHMKGLSPSWGLPQRSTGNPRTMRSLPFAATRILYCTAQTRCLLLNEFGNDLSHCTVALPLYEWITIPVGRTGYSIRVCLLPSCHIPGSAMFLMRTFLGTMLYTGDVKATPGLRRLLRHVLAVHPVDHLYLDDTWVHLSARSAVQVPLHHHSSSTNPLHGGDDGSRILRDEQEEEEEEQDGDCKLLTALRFEKALDGIARHLETLEAARPCGGVAGIEREGLDVAGKLRPYAVRVYLHNQFGKEVLVQRLAKKLRTTVMVSDARYRRLEALAAQRPPKGPERDAERYHMIHKLRTLLLVPDPEQPLTNHETSLFSSISTPLTSSSARPSSSQQVFLTDAYLSRLLDDVNETEIDLEYFVPASSLVAKLTAECLHLPPEDDAAAAAPADSCRTEHLDEAVNHPVDSIMALPSHTSGLPNTVVWTVPLDIPRIEVVESRREVAVDVLQRAAASSSSSSSSTTQATTETQHSEGDATNVVSNLRQWIDGVPTFGLIMTGWARVQTRDTQTNLLWQIPYSLHSSPAQLRCLMRLVQPKSVLSIQPGRGTTGREKGHALLAALGPFLREPYVNRIIGAATLNEVVVPISMIPYTRGGLRTASGGTSSSTEWHYGGGEGASSMLAGRAAAMARVLRQQEQQDGTGRTTSQKGVARGVTIGRSPRDDDEETDDERQETRSTGGTHLELLVSSSDHKENVAPLLVDLRNNNNINPNMTNCGGRCKRLRPQPERRADDEDEDQRMQQDTRHSRVVTDDDDAARIASLNSFAALLEAMTEQDEAEVPKPDCLEPHLGDLPVESGSDWTEKEKLDMELTRVPVPVISCASLLALVDDEAPLY